VATERLFDKQLAAIKFPAATESIAQALDARRQAGDASVEAEVAAIRKALGLPPEPTS
jgi:hypothetical protein